MKKKLIFFWAFLLGAVNLFAQDVLLPFGARWQYLDNGTDQGTAWKEPSFNDGSWKSGQAKLGYGNNDEASVISYGEEEDYKHITTYFRTAFTVTDTAGISGYRLNLKRDDGAVVYVNGTEVYRTNMPAGTITYATEANSHASKNGNTLVKKSFPAGVVGPGRNVIAVEIHQATRTSADIAFDLELTAAPDSLPPVEPGAGGELTRGPYLQMGSGTAMTLRWRTDKATDSKVEAGTLEGKFTLSATNPLVTTEHEVRITGLKAGARYFYRFGSSTDTLGGGSDFYFYTAPPATTTRKIAIAAFGDCGKESNGNQSGSLGAYRNHVTFHLGEIMVLLGDNAYADGKDTEYQKNFFNVYTPTLLRNHVLFPAPGNHDYHTTTRSARTAPYFKIFSMPTEAECGGVPSGTKAYYSFDWGNVHFLSLDSYGTEADGSRLYDTLGMQATWVKKDLEANTREWVVAILHHPPYTKGTHDSDEESDLTPIRKKFIRILERYGVDLVLSGHSHNYERSYLLDSFYTKESSFNPALHAKSNSSGKYDGSINSCPYVTTRGQANKGSVYVVSGSSGNGGKVSKGFPHNALPFAFNAGGMFYLEVKGNRLDGRFLRTNGTVADRFTIMHNVNTIKTIRIAPGGTAKLQASWEGAYRWSTGATTRYLVVRPEETTTYKVVDEQGCLTDEFQVIVPDGGAATTRAAIMEAEQAAGGIKVYPTQVRRGQKITIRAGGKGWNEIEAVDAGGRVLRSLPFSGNGSLDTGTLPAGTYFLKVRGRGRVQVQKFVVTQ